MQFGRKPSWSWSPIEEPKFTVGGKVDLPAAPAEAAAKRGPVCARLSPAQLDAKFGEFNAAFAQEVARAAGEDVLSGDLHSDGPLEAGEFNFDTAVALREGGPWGAGFAEPAFDGRFGVLDTRVVGNRHLKLKLRAPSGEVADAIAFRYLDDPSALALRPQDTIDLVYRAALDEYGGARRLQLVSEWLRQAQA